MYIMRLLCLTSLRIINALDGNSCLFFEKNKTVEHTTSVAHIEQILSAGPQQCESRRSTSRLKEQEQMKCYLNSNFSMSFERICQHNMYTYRNIRVQCTSCSSKDAGKTVEITCPSKKAVNNDDNPNDSSISDFIFPTQNYHNACKNSLMCRIRKRRDNMQKPNMNWLCKVVKPVDDRTTESYVVKPVDDRTTESYGIPDYVFILGGISGVLIITCIIVAVFLLRKNNCNEFRNTEMTINDQIMPTVNPTYTPSSRPSKHENHQKANLVKAPGGSNLSTTHAVYFDNRTDDKAIKLCPIQQPGIQANKHESNTYSHLRTSPDDSDDMYDHTVRNAVRNTCDGDYGVAHITITEDDYNVSGTCNHPLTNKEDPVYT